MIITNFNTKHYEFVFNGRQINKRKHSDRYYLDFHKKGKVIKYGLLALDWGKTKDFIKKSIFLTLLLTVQSANNSKIRVAITQEFFGSDDFGYLFWHHFFPTYIPLLDERQHVI